MAIMRVGRIVGPVGRQSPAIAVTSPINATLLFMETANSWPNWELAARRHSVWGVQVWGLGWAHIYLDLHRNGVR